ncbi:MAG: acyl-CoA dehydrogenase family protein, partial [Sciscionella sp.]
MDFTLDEAQRAVADLTADLLRRQSGSGHSAEAFAEDPGYDQSLWKSMAQAGLLCLAVPSALGGDGLGALETALLLAEVGRRAAAVPAFATLALGVLPVAMAGTAAAQRQLLAGVAEGEVLLSGAVNEAGQPFPALPRTTATPSGDGFLVSGTKVAVPYAAAARHILVPATLPDGRVVVPVVDPALAGVKLTRTPSSTGAPEYTLVLDSVWIAPGRMLGDGVAAALYRCALAGACAVGDGAVAGVLALTSEHAGSRNQFGRPVA